MPIVAQLASRWHIWPRRRSERPLWHGRLNACGRMAASGCDVLEHRTFCVVVCIMNDGPGGVLWNLTRELSLVDRSPH